MTFNQGRALVIGVSSYQHVRKLPVAVLNDAHDIAAVLSHPDLCALDPGNVTLLLDGDATLSGIRAALGNLSQACKADDTVIIYFTGHGGILGDGAKAATYLVPVDGNLMRYEHTMLSEAEFSRILKALSARRVLVILDACHAGGAVTLKGSVDEVEEFTPGYTSKSLALLSEGAGRAVFASCAPSETSLVLGSARNSLFTTHLLEGLRGKGEPIGSQVVRIFNLFGYVAPKVQAESGGKQSPNFKADVDANFAVAMVEGASKKSTAELMPASELSTFDWEALLSVLQDLYPLGPTEQHIWRRAGGDLSRIVVSGSGASAWYGAIHEVRNGGGGGSITLRRLADVASKDYSNNQILRRLIG